MPNVTDLLCKHCAKNVPATHAHTVTAVALLEDWFIKLHFCSSVCWVAWFKAVKPHTYQSIILPPLDGYDIGRAQRAMRKKAA